MSIRVMIRELTGKRLVIICVVAIAFLTAHLAYWRVSAHSHYMRGIELVRTHKYKEAIRSYTEAVAIEPQYADVYSARGQVYSRVREYDQAIGDFSRSIAIAPSIRAFMGRALVHGLNRNYEQVIRDCDAAITINSGYAKAYYLKGLSFEKLDRTSDAIDAYESYLKHVKPGQHPNVDVIKAKIDKLATSSTMK